ncbi:MAG: alanine--tRNA ligase [Bacteroidaceae bacterium]|nr:alanine--tRNA ligase [Bacteroidaceae bacterium]MBQ9170139.1 alanine--tRNA ligase [Bacteroidaceae bacterium]MBQ9294769.1 alanine--tRNA ligase [Bacteroidaceae bacterium]
MLTANEIRDSFLRYFESKGHKIVPSAPMVVKDDPTLMFTNAGMNQWKDIILGTRDPEPRRRADSQKCLRVSGKHNDLEEVGHDTYHHTMFEMLGNWSFGDYFKEGAIDMAWEYLVDVLKLDPKDLYVTVFEGSPEENLSRDDEAAGYWLKHVPADHIINGNKHDNFWEMGDTGPCGPCSEIHLDSRSAEEKAKVPGRELVNKDDPQVIEIWNIVFMQYERKADGHLEPLGMNVIDTGMGFERLVRAIQGKQSNYDTDVFQPIIKAIGDLSGYRYGEKEDIDVAMRVVADHLRTIAFSIADGQLPGNAKAGYVIRRILRRAVRYAYTFLGQKQAFLYRLLPVLIQEMGATYPELEGQKELITKVMKEEEESFLRTLETGIKLLDGVMKEAKAAGKTEIAGEKAFTLFDTYGFPLDLTELICRENGLTVDEVGFNVEMQKQKERARNAAQVEAGDWQTPDPSKSPLKGETCGNDSSPFKGETEGVCSFVGYDYTEYTCHIVKYREVKQKKGVVYEAIFDQTPFYGEMGGEVGDTGVICNEQETIKVLDTKKENGVTVHLLERIPQNPAAEFMACVDVERRRAIEANHTCTHLLDQALKEVLGDHVEQKGSLVTPDYLRFDFSHFEKVTPEQIREVEHLVNERIRQNLPLQEYRDTPIEEAKKLGAIALFGEKYGDKVRVIQFGTSVEFCGGCHASSTGCIGMVRILSESSVAAGVRRIEAITGKAVEEAIDKQQDLINSLRSLFNNAPDLMGTIQKAISDNAELRKQVEDTMREKAADLKKEMIAKQKKINGIKVLSAITPLGAEFVKDIAFQLRAEVENSLVVIGSVTGDKPLLTAAASDSVVAAGVNVGKNIREAAQLMQGGGGGQPHFATAGGKNPDGLHAAVQKLIELLTA